MIALLDVDYHPRCCGSRLPAQQRRQDGEVENEIGDGIFILVCRSRPSRVGVSDRRAQDDDALPDTREYEIVRSGIEGQRPRRWPITSNGVNGEEPGPGICRFPYSNGHQRVKLRRIAASGKYFVSIPK